jgi:hypothetical protein
MTTAAHLPILRRTGRVLLVIGVVDIAVLVACMAQGIPYPSSFNIVAVVGGIFLLRGSLRAATLVRRLSLSMLSLLGALVLLSPVLQPPSLTLAMARTHTGLALLAAVSAVALALLMAWLARQLGSPAVLSAVAASGRKLRSTRWPLLMGAGIALLLAGTSVLMQRSAAGQMALAQARAAHGDGYRYHLSSLALGKAGPGGSGRSVTAIVSAWNDHELRLLPIELPLP